MATLAPSSKRHSKPLLLISSAGIALVLLCLCAFSTNTEAASIARSGIGIDKRTDESSLKRRTTTAAYSYHRMLGNIGNALMGSDNQVPGVQAGAVIASPSTASPDYFYSWVRDAALTMKVVVSQSTFNRTLLESYANAEKMHQQSAASSSVTLGEPKFNVDGSLFTGPWGRPQNDGPALRALTLMTFAKRIGLTDAFTTGTLYKPNLNGDSVIKLDLEYVAHHWNENGFDLWEEVNGKHFFTLAVSRRSLIDGAKFAIAMADPGAAAYYNQQADAIKTTLQSFWDGTKIQAYQGVSGRSGIDCSVLLGALRGWDTSDMNTAVDPTEFGPASDRVLASHKQYVDAFRSLYSINKNAAAPKAVATGRYPEDVYNGVGASTGNPWYICTLASAEVLNTALDVATRRGSISVTSISAPFFQQFSSSISQGTYASDSSQYAVLTRGMRAMAQGFVEIVQSHTWPNGSMNEQFNRDTGFNQGSRDLTWSYAAFISNDLTSNNQFLLP